MKRFSSIMAALAAGSVMAVLASSPADADGLSVMLPLETIGFSDAWGDRTERQVPLGGHVLAVLRLDGDTCGPLAADGAAADFLVFVPVDLPRARPMPARSVGLAAESGDGGPGAGPGTPSCRSLPLRNATPSRCALGPATVGSRGMRPCMHQGHA